MTWKNSVSSDNRSKIELSNDYLTGIKRNFTVICPNTDRVFMKEGIFINGRQIQLRYSGANIELDLSAAKQAAQAIHHAVEEVETKKTSPVVFCAARFKGAGPLRDGDPVHAHSFANCRSRI